MHINLITTFRPAGALVCDRVFGFNFGSESKGEKEEERGEKTHCGQRKRGSGSVFGGEVCIWRTRRNRFSQYMVMWLVWS